MQAKDKTPNSEPAVWCAPSSWGAPQLALASRALNEAERADGFLEKPFHCERFLSLVKYILAKG